jgi:hypothetical protein
MNSRAILQKPWGVPLVIFIVASIFFTWNLAGQYYQLDEAGTVSQADGIRYFGYPAGWDGRNLLSDNNGREYNLAKGSYFWTWQPPLQSVTAYLGSEFFGQTVFGYRFFFALFGAGTVALFYHIANMLFKKRWIVFLITAQLLLSLPFFLYVRQVRYYAPSAFFTTLFLYLFIKAWRKEWGRKELVLLAIASTLLFLTNYFVWAGSVASLGLLFLWQRNRNAAIVLTLTGIIPVLWYVLFRPFAGNPTGAYNRNISLYSQLFRYFPYIHSHLLPFFFLPLFTLGKRPPPLFFVLIGVILMKLALYSLFLDTHGRYLIDVMPILFLLYGFLYQSLDTVKTRLLVPVIFISTLLIANLGSLFPKAMLGETVPVLPAPNAYKVELLGNYPTMLRPIASYMQLDYREGDIFWANSYRNTLYLTSGIPHLSPVCDQKTKKPLGPSAVTDREKIRWFIFFQGDPRFQQDLTTVPCLGKEWQQKLERDYVKSTFRIPPGFSLVNDPDIVGRQFPPVQAKPDQVTIYEKREFYAYKKT